MEGYVLLSRSDGRSEATCEEQRQEEEEEEDIGCPSESEPSATDSMSEGKLDDEASSSSSSLVSTESFEMSSLMTQLPLKRGLSKFFDGKSQSFASLAAVGGLEDLAKPMRKRLKTSRSCCGVGLQDAHRGGRFSRPRCHNNADSAAAAFKKVSRGRLSSLGAAPGRLTLPPMTARPVGLPGRALLFA